MHLLTELSTIEFAKSLANEVSEGTVIWLVGPLGVGKTTFARGFLKGKGFEGEVRSPTFNLVHEYHTKPKVCHADLYRIEKPEDVWELGLDEYLQDSILLIEWPERGGEFVPDYDIKIELSFCDNGRIANITRKTE